MMNENRLFTFAVNLKKYRDYIGLECRWQALKTVLKADRMYNEMHAAPEMEVPASTSASVNVG